MHPKALIGLVRSKLAYIEAWPELVAVTQEGSVPAQHERVFDLSEVLQDQDREVAWDYEKVGHHLPFPCFAVVGNGDGVFIICGDEEGFYAFCYSSPVQMLLVRFIPTGWSVEGIRRVPGEKPEFLTIADPRVNHLTEAVALILTVIEEACANTRNMVSYTLNRTERRNTIREVGAGSLDGTLVHHVCLNQTTRASLLERRRDTVVPTPKRLHEVRSHWRHMRSGIVVRVKAHVRGKGDHLLPRVYTPLLANPK